tara:strand:- start:22066 stop:22545 length:480 start_codon:yes stop_codon:yes gene_type:complete
MLVSKKIILRTLKKSDLSFLKHIENNSDNWIFGSENRVFNDKELLQYIKHSKDNIVSAKQFRWLIEYNNHSVGFVDLYDYNLTYAYLGIIIESKFRNKGFAKQSINIITKYSFNVLRLERLYSKVLTSNSVSINLFNSCDFKLYSQNDKFQIFVKLATQ